MRRKVGPEPMLERLGEEDRRWREELLRLTGRVVPYIGVEIEGIRYFFNTADAKIAERLFVKPDLRRDGIHLRRSLAAIVAAGLPDVPSQFVDVGAHIGTTAIAAVIRHGFRQAIALEPHPENFMLLRLNVVANGLEGAVRTLETAVSSSQGTAALDVSSPASELHSLGVGGDGRRTQQVPTTTIDALSAEGVIDPDEVGLLWIDVEGHELDVLDGASDLLERGVPIAMELCPKKLSRARRLDDAPGLIAQHYTHVLDLRRPVASGPEFRPAAELPTLIEQYAGHCVDLLALRRPA